jgi:hypothetical protein
MANLVHNQEKKPRRSGAESREEASLSGRREFIIDRMLPVGAELPHRTGIRAETLELSQL